MVDRRLCKTNCSIDESLTKIKDMHYKLIYLRKWALINTIFLAFKVKMYGSVVVLLMVTTKSLISLSASEILYQGNKEF